MEISSLLAVSFAMKMVAALLLIVSMLLILIILVQKGKGGGLSSAFGGGQGGGVLGTKTGDFLTWTTIALVGLWFFLAILMAKFYKPTVSEFDRKLPASPAGQTAPAQERPVTTAPETPAGNPTNKPTPAAPVAPANPSPAAPAAPQAPAEKPNK
jgi:preprotein translocase subunit SecG